MGDKNPKKREKKKQVKVKSVDISTELSSSVEKKLQPTGNKAIKKGKK